MKTQQAAIGKWKGILRHFGVSEEYLQNRHGPCPMCGGKDRYRFDDKDGKGTYYCSGCGAGDGMKLLLELTGLDFKDAAKQVDALVGNIKSVVEEKPKDNGRIAWVTRNMIPARSCPEVLDYLRNRNLPCSSGLFAVPKMKYYEGRKLEGEFCSLISPFKAVSGELITYHVTYIKNGQKAHVNAPKKVLTPLSDMSGGCLRICGQFETMGLAEGVETALAVMRDFKLPCWASSTAGMMEKFAPPEGVRKLIIFGDNDANYAGQKSAYIIANKLSLQGYEIEVRLPEIVGDFADL